jgi:pimeloyl-ACP methyl ester carboxylesterase
VILTHTHTLRIHGSKFHLILLGVNVLKSTPLRMYANKIAYYDDDTFATKDAMNIGRLHCYVQSWKDASVDFLLSGGFVVSDKVPKVQQDTLLLWGSKDAIISPTTADKFVTVMPRCELTWVEECGHVPHLEQPSFTAQQITQFLK